VYLIPVDSVIWVVRYVVAFIFLAFFPGYCLINFLFQDGQFDFAELLVLSVALSFSLAGISGLFLGLSPLGINVNSIVATVSGMVLVLAALAYGRKVGLVKAPVLKLQVRKPRTAPVSS
jgi:uncharacterized membrane protein